MTIWGIVGHEDAKFTTVTEQYARQAIRSLLRPGDEVVSGACHLGGIDIWAIEEAKAMGLVTREYAPKFRAWDAPGGFQDRNIQIAKDCDEAVCIVVRVLPPTYKGMRFSVCYHCATKENPKPDHVKSGGCWTVKYAREKLGKPGRIIVV